MKYYYSNEMMSAIHKIQNHNSIIVSQLLDGVLLSYGVYALRHNCLQSVIISTAKLDHYLNMLACLGSPLQLLCTRI